MEKSAIVAHFQAEGFSRRTIYATINRLQAGQPIKDKKRTGRPSSWNASRASKLKRLVNNRTGISQRGLGRQFSVNHSTISRQLARMSISYRKREKTAKYSAVQQQKSQQLAGQLANNLYRSRCSVILDDEKYFRFSGHNMPCNVGYYSSNKSTCLNISFLKIHVLTFCAATYATPVTMKLLT